MKLKFFLFMYVCLSLLFIFINQNFKLNNTNNIFLEYDSLQDGDFIPFDSVIRGDIYKFYKYVKHGEQFFYTAKGHVESFLKACYCKSDNCLKTKTCDKTFPVLKLGENNSFTYNVLNYKRIFKNDNSDYIGWNIYYLPVDYSNPNIDDSFDSLIGKYYYMVLIPTKKNVDYNSSLKVKANEIKSISADTLVNWSYDDTNIYFLDNENEGYLTFNFDAKKNDIVTFDIKTSSTTIEIYLNGKSINSNLDLSDDLPSRELISRYTEKTINIEEDGHYTISFNEKEIDNKHNENYYRYTYIKNFMVLSKIYG